MRRGKIAPVIAGESRRNTYDLPIGYGLTPNGLAQGQSRLDGRRSLHVDAETSNGPAVIIHDDGEPGAYGRSIAGAHPDIQQGMIGLPDIVGLLRVVSVEQIVCSTIS